MVYFPAKNEVTRQMDGWEPEYPDDADDKRYIVLFDEDFEGTISDVEGNLALLVDEEQAREVKWIAEDVIDQLSEGGDE